MDEIIFISVWIWNPLINAQISFRRDLFIQPFEKGDYVGAILARQADFLHNWNETKGEFV